MKKTLAAIMTAAIALSSSLTVFAAPETIQMEEPVPLPQDAITKNNINWTSLPETAYNDCFRRVIDCLAHGHPLAEYSYTKDNTLDYWWYSWEYDANGNMLKEIYFSENGLTGYKIYKYADN